MSNSHFVGKVAQKALIIKDGTVLITRDSNDEVWELPGGRLYSAENPREGILREIIEELGVEGKVDGIYDVRTMFHTRDAADMLVVYYLVSLIDESVQFVVGKEEVAEMAWVDSESYKSYSFFPEYERVLSEYFDKVPS